jgi:transposase-like protein
MINYCLKQTAPQPALDLGQYQHLVLDGTFLHRPRSLTALMDAQTHVIVAGQYGISESSEPQLREFLERLIPVGLRPLSFTVDGNPKVMRVIRQLWPGVVVQRCLVHIQRQGLSWCRTFPKTTYARRLRKIFLQVTRIRTTADRDTFLGAVIDWENKYGSQISERRETGYVFSDIKRARSMLMRALPDMFHYLDSPLIPISTNVLEGYFSRLKGRYRQHRGLRKEKRKDYFRWYFCYVPK